jgi:acetyltransferase-like isoleucine patch superfamily enzyme
VHLEEKAQIGFANIVRGGASVVLKRYATVLRFNVLNSIPDNDCKTVTDPRLILDEGAYVVSGHRLDFTDRIRLGRNVIVAGRNSSLWTHNRQDTKPIDVADFCYLGSEVRVAPGATLGDNAILAMGAVLAGSAEGGQVHGGVPARPIRGITEEEGRILRRGSRKDIPDDLYGGD